MTHSPFEYHVVVYLSHFNTRSGRMFRESRRYFTNSWNQQSLLSSSLTRLIPLMITDTSLFIHIDGGNSLITTQDVKCTTYWQGTKTSLLRT